MDQFSQKMIVDVRDPILITGCARSGTSMVAGAIHLCGAWKGDTSGPNSNNKKGMFENIHIRQHIVKPYLRQLGVDPLGQYPLPDVDNLQIPRNWKARILQVLEKEGYKGGPWMYKGAKMCLFWPVWQYAFPNAKWIIVRRRTGDIVYSCMHTGFMRAFARLENQRKVGASDEREGWIWWVRQHEQRFREMIEVGMNVKIVWPERMVCNDFSQMMETIEWLGLEWNSAVLSFIEPKLWKARQKRLLINRGKRTVN